MRNNHIPPEETAAKVAANTLNRALSDHLAPTRVLEEYSRAYSASQWSLLPVEQVGKRHPNLLHVRVRESPASRSLLRQAVDRIRAPLVARRSMVRPPLEYWQAIMTRFSLHNPGGPAGWAKIPHSLTEAQISAPASFPFLPQGDIDSRFPDDQNPGHTSFTARIADVGA